MRDLSKVLLNSSRITASKCASSLLNIDTRLSEFFVLAGISSNLFLQPESLTFLFKVCLCSIQLVSVIVLSNVEMKNTFLASSLKAREFFDNDLCSTVSFRFLLEQFERSSSFVECPFHRSDHVRNMTMMSIWPKDQTIYSIFYISHPR